MSKLHGRTLERERGSVLIMCMAILGLLLIFGLTFARLMSIERQASSNMVEWVRAKLAATAGIERALADLQREQGSLPYSRPVSIDPTKSSSGYPVCSPVEHGGAACPNTPNPVFVRSCDDVTSDLRPLDLETIRYPSSWTEAPPHEDGSPRLRFGVPLTYSGLISRPHATALLVYRLKVLDAASQINLNHPDARSANRMLKNLLRASIEQVRAFSEADAIAVADRVIPPTGPAPHFGSKAELGRLLVVDPNDPSALPGISEQEWLYAVQDSVTVRSWTDPSVIRPLLLNGEADSSLAPAPRSPVNLNTASQPALTALFAEVRAKTRFGTFGLTYENAAKLAKAIRARTYTADGPFKTWLEFEEFVDGVDASVFAGGVEIPSERTAWVDDLEWAPAGGFYEQVHTQYQVGFRDLVKAVANPNTMLNKLGQLPNHGGYEHRIPRMVDKTDLTQMTTEGCLDSMGVFEITSLGLLLNENPSLGPDGATPIGYETIAKYVKRVVVEVYKPFRLTTQADFERHRLLKAVGNFIAAPEVTHPTMYNSPPAVAASTNRAVFLSGTDYSGAALPIPGWPGVISGPEYSIDRQSDANAGYPLRPAYSPATWDGNLQLTNLVTVRTSEHDFVAGFARGRLDAFKARAWWEPKDLLPNAKPLSATPTRPADAAELTRLTRPLTGDPPAVDPSSRSVRVRVDGESERASLIALGAAPANAERVHTDLLRRGSQLLNSGVLVAPDRGGAADPGFLAYDSDNLDLQGGCSIRFWVQPLRDPYAQQEEVLLYFMGSNGAEPGNDGGIKREAGFKISKVVEGGRIYVRLTTLPNDGTTHTDDGAVVDYEWAAAGINTIDIDVTPEEPYGNDTPERPQWIPGSWHWIVLDLGPDDQLDSSGYVGSSVHMKVDNCDAVTNSTAAPSTTIYFKASSEPGLTPVQEFGELHGYYYNPNAGDWIEPVSKTNSTSGLVRWKLLPRQLGDFYHCQRTAPEANYSNNGDGSRDHGRGVASVRRERVFGAPGQTPVLQFSGVDMRWYPLYPTGTSHGWYHPTATWPSQPVPFPLLAYDRKLTLQGYSGSSPVAGASLPLQWNGTQFVLNWPLSKGLIFGADGSSGPMTVTTTTTTTDPDTGETTTTTTTTTLVNGSSGGYPGHQEWHLALVATWEEAHYRTSSDWTRNDSITVGGTTNLARLKELLPVEYPKMTGEALPSGYGPGGEWKFGETLPYAAHNSGGGGKGGSAGPAKQRGVSTTNFDGLVGSWFLPGGRPRSYIRTKEPLNASVVPGVSRIHLDCIDDDCRGCEDCDLDGPLFLGGQPQSTTNYAGGKPQSLELGTMSYAIFDNLVILNHDPRRRSDGSTPAATDLFSSTGEINVAGAEATESRFFEEDTFEYASRESGNPNLALGAVYHRALDELRGVRGRIGSVTWTSYPTSGSALDFGVALWKLSDATVDAPGITSANYDKPTFGGAHPSGYATDPGVGVDLSTDDTRLVEGSTEFSLVLGIRLQELRNTAGAIPTMLTQSPVFEDVTINVIHETPIFLYVEEEAEE